MPKIDLSEVEESTEEDWEDYPPSDPEDSWYESEEYEEYLYAEMLSQLNSEVGLNVRSHFKDKKHPLAHIDDDKEVWEAEHRRILEHIHSIMDKRGISQNELREALPDKNGAKGISDRRMREIVNQKPETASVQQVVAMCKEFQCSIDYLKGLVHNPEQRVNWGSPADMENLYRHLSVSNRATVWKIAIALLKEDRESYLDFMEEYF